jgi:hypothetical protein
MVWQRFKRIFGHDSIAEPPPEMPWIKAEDNPWHVPVLFIGPCTQTLTSWSKEKSEAQNAMSFPGDDGKEFIGKAPKKARHVNLNLSYRIEPKLYDGVLFTPRAMEDKWALFYHQRQIIFVRSWLREVHAVADVVEGHGQIEIKSLSGALTRRSRSFDVRALDFILRSHALREKYPAPLPSLLAYSPTSAVTWCMSVFGQSAEFATHHAFPREVPTKPLRTDSLLHLATAKQDFSAIDQCLSAGFPIDLLASDGFPPLQWAPNAEMIDFLLQRGSPIDVRSAEGATPLMTVVQQPNLQIASYLLERGADPNACDVRGFTALHRAAELGEIKLVRLLLDHGAEADIEADGHTPRSLAKGKGHSAIIDLFR